MIQIEGGSVQKLKLTGQVSHLILDIDFCPIHLVFYAAFIECLLIMVEFYLMLRLCQDTLLFMF